MLRERHAPTPYKADFLSAIVSGISIHLKVAFKSRQEFFAFFRAWVPRNPKEGSAIGLAAPQTFQLEMRTRKRDINIVTELKAVDLAVAIALRTWLFPVIFLLL